MSSQKVLVLDDELYRVEYLREKCPELEVHHVETVSAFCRRLGVSVIDQEMERHLLNFDSDKYDLIVLDHDLGTKEDGADACEFIPGNFETPILIWSFNPVGALEMSKILKRKGATSSRCPFGSEAVEWLKEILSAKQTSKLPPT